MVKKPIKYKKKQYNFDTMFPNNAVRACHRCGGNMVRQTIAERKHWVCTRCGNGV